MKNYKIYFLLIFLCTVFIISSCDKIESPYFQESDDVDTTECPIPDFPAVSNPQRIVLLEEFTGHKCPNCPAGAAIAHALMNNNPDKLIVAAIHAGYFATADVSGHFTSNFVVSEGEEIANNFNVVVNPIALINRKTYNSSLLINTGDWGAAVAAIINEPPQMYLQTISLHRSEDNSYCLHTKINFLEDMQGNFNLCVYIVEDSIVSPQKTNDVTNYPSGYIENYVHNHVLRKVLGGTWGKPISDGQVSGGTSIIQSFKLIPSTGWNLNKCKVVSFIYNTETDEIIQASETHLTN